MLTCDGSLGCGAQDSVSVGLTACSVLGGSIVQAHASEPRVTFSSVVSQPSQAACLV